MNGTKGFNQQELISYTDTSQRRFTIWSGLAMQGLINNHQYQSHDWSNKEVQMQFARMAVEIADSMQVAARELEERRKENK